LRTAPASLALPAPRRRLPSRKLPRGHVPSTHSHPPLSLSLSLSLALRDSELVPADVVIGGCNARDFTRALDFALLVKAAFLSALPRDDRAEIRVSGLCGGTKLLD